MYCAGEESSSSTLQSCLNQRSSSRCWGSPGMVPHHEASYSEEQIGAAAKAYYYYSSAASNNANANANANATSLHSHNNLVKTETVIPSYSPFIMADSEMLLQPTKMARPSSMVPQEEDLIGRLDECVSDANSANSSAVDCTLSLSTPSTRFRNSSSSSSSPTCSSPPSSPALPFYAWNDGFWFQQQQQGPVSEAAAVSGSARGSMLQYMGVGVNKQGPCYAGLGIRNNAASAPNIFSHNMMGVSGRKQGGPRAGSDGSAPRKCANCDTTTTPLWRNGPKGPKSLCNACGIRFKKEERRITATVQQQQQSPDRPKPAEDGDGRSKDKAAERERENSNSCLTWQSSSSSSRSSCCAGAGAVAQGRLGIGLGTAIVDCSFNAHTESSCRSGTELAAAAGGCEGSASAAAAAGVGGPAQTTQPLLVLGLSVHGK